jgi:hypothetical protein
MQITLVLILGIQIACGYCIVFNTRCGVEWKTLGRGHYILFASTPNNKIVSCETEGSCRETRVAYKAELERIRQQKREEGRPMEEDYLQMLSGKPSSPIPDGERKKYSPFGKKTNTK